MVGTLLCGAACVLGQAAAAPAAKQKPMAFDVVTIKLNKSGDLSMITNSPKDGYGVTNMLLMQVISDAYEIRWDLISGAPGWVESNHYDIAAKVVPEDASFKELTKEQRREMLRAMLADRFGLKAHIEMKELPAYEMSVAKGGPKLTEAAEGKQTDWGANNGDFRVTAISMATLAELLSGNLRRTVSNKTGLTGKYTFRLQWTPDDGPPPMLNGAPDTSWPSLFTAVQEQLGLRLDATKALTKTLVIDAIQLPTEN